MKKTIAWILVLTTLLLAGCQRVADPTDPTNGPGLSAGPTDPQPTDPEPTDSQPTETQPTETQPTEPEPTDPIETQPSEPAVTEPVLAIPDEFPADLITDEAALAAFQAFFDENIWARQANRVRFEDPREMNLRGFFFGAGMEEDIPVTEEDRAAIVASSGVESFYDRKAYCLSAEKMDQVLQETFGVPLSEMTGFANLYYLESSGNYCYFHMDTDPVVKVNVMGTRTMEDGSVEVYYRNAREDEDYPKYYGVMTLKPAGETYHIVSNVNINVWPEPGHVPQIPEGAPADLNTDADVVKKFQDMFDNGSWYTQALFEEYDDPRNIRLNDFLFCAMKPWPYTKLTMEETEKLRQQFGITNEWWVDRYSMEAATVEEVLQSVFGYSMADFMDSDNPYIVYLESTDCYYYGRTDSSLVQNVSVAGIRELENGNIEVYYTCDWLYPEEGFVTLKPVGDSYIVVSNAAL